MNQNQHSDTTLAKKLGLVMAISITMLLFCLGVIHIRNTGIPVPTPIIVLIFAIAFITGTVFLELRGGVFPWIMLGGGVVAVTLSVLVTCVFSGIIFIVTGKIFAVPWDVLVYSLSACMIISVIILNILPCLPDLISKLSEHRIESMNNVKSHYEADYYFEGDDMPDPNNESWVDSDQGPPEDCRI